VLFCHVGLSLNPNFRLDEAIADSWIIRWLASRDRMDEAAKIIYKYHGGEDNEVAKLEVREVALHVSLNKPQTPWEYIRGLWDYRELFNSHPAR
jgi:hypothetical protein